MSFTLLKTQKRVASKFYKKSKNIYQKLDKLLPLLCTYVLIYSNFELTVDECLFGICQAFLKCITQYYKPSLSMDCAEVSCSVQTCYAQSGLSLNYESTDWA